MNDAPLSIGRYEIIRTIGRGGFGQVFEARDSDLDRRVAIKRLLPSQDPTHRERFLREARSVARLDHPNIVRVFDAGVDGDAPYIVQELLEGDTLDVVLRRTQALAPATALRILIAVADAVGAAHDAGLVHRDIKPSNIFLTANRRVKVIDFGIAAITDLEAAGLTMSGAFLGTPAYSSPEQLEGKRVDERSDMFSFGAVAYEVLTGRRAFEAASVHLVVLQVIEGRPADLTPDIQAYPDLAQLIHDCLERDPSRRPASMREVVRRLAHVQQLLTHDDDGWPVDESPSADEAALQPSPQLIQGTMAGPVISPSAPASHPMDSAAPRSPIPFRPPPPPTACAERPAPGGLRPGAVIGRFTIHELVAHGQTGHLYRAYDPVRSKLVGLKVIERPDDVAVQRLLRASRIWLDLTHPNLQRIKVEWFRTTYDDEFPDLSRSVLSTERPSIVAHSVGTYILGHALLRYPYLRFNKVLLCGSILPRDFPWDVIIDRGQVQEVRNEFGARDVWTTIAQAFVTGTGSSGTHGFTRTHDRLHQEEFDYAHSEYFERGHMRDRWIPFLRKSVTHITPRDVPVTLPRATTPWGVWLLYGTLAVAAAAFIRLLATTLV